MAGMWVKRVDPNASPLMRAWGQHALETQAHALGDLGDLAVAHSYRNGMLMTAHAGGRPSFGTFTRSWYEGSKRIGILNDIRRRNMGANGLIFDPAWDIVEKSLAVGGGVSAPVIGIGVAQWASE